MKKTKKILSMCLALMMVTCAIPMAAFGANSANAIIDENAEGSIAIYKYDFTNAQKDGVWDNDSFVSTGWGESYVQEVLSGGEHDYAIEGVEFSYLKVADIITFSETIDTDEADENLIQVLYGFKADDALLDVINPEAFAHSDMLNDGMFYATSDALNAALAEAQEADPTGLKNALEAYMAEVGGEAMDLTDANGYAIAEGLELGLYLVVETKVPEMVTSTVNPFFVSVPMTTVSGDDNSESPEGGHEWNYDVVVYPKNETGIPTLEKTVREAMADTGKNDGSDVITDGFAHTATGSAGDVMEYQIISNLPTITSKATALSVYEFYDTISEGLTYNKDSVEIEIFSDEDCTEKVATWTKADDKFVVDYSEDGRHMTIRMLRMGLEEINGDFENLNGALYTGYSNYTMRITYSAVIDSDNSFIYGEAGNDNKVVLTWKRTSSEFSDTLIDDAHVYSFGIDMTKKFSDKEADVAENEGLFEHVKFVVRNETDGYWVVAELNEEEGVYYVTGRADNEEDATIFVPVNGGKVVIKGCEDDEYVITEIETANGYTLLKDSVNVIINADDIGADCDIYSEDVVGVLQNDPYYAYDGGLDLKLANIPQKQLAHSVIEAEASVNDKMVNMLADGNSVNALAPLTIVNTRGFDLPKTGDVGTWMYGAFGIGIMATAAGAIMFVLKKKENEA